MNVTNQESNSAANSVPAVATNPKVSERAVATFVRKAFGWLLFGILLVPLIGKFVMMRNAAVTPGVDVFPPSVDAAMKTVNRGVVGAWSPGSAPSNKYDGASIDPGELILVRTFDLDGWILRLLSLGRLTPMLDKETAPLLEKWALQLLDGAAQKAAGKANAQTSEPLTPEAKAAGEVMQEKFNRLFIEVRMRLNLTINDQIVPELSALNASESRSLKDAPGDRWDDFVFRLKPEDEAQRKVFQDLARGSGLSEKVRLSLSFPVDKEKTVRLIVPTVLEPNAAVPSQRTEVSFAPVWKVWFMIIYGLAIVAGMTLLGLQTNMLRGLMSRRRPNGKYQLSLSHVQLAIWFVVVFGAYIYLWVITGSLNTLSTSGLYLVGIAIVTSLGSTAIQGMSTSDKEVMAYNNTLAPRLEMDRATVWALVDQAEAVARQKWEQMQHSGISGSDTASQDAFRNWDDLRRQKEYLATPLIYRWLVDLLSENGEVTLHRFQMLAWTVGLAFIFCVRVFADLTMPTFPGEVLTLMGISAGTYLGFRVPEANKIKDTLANPESLGSSTN